MDEKVKGIFLRISPSELLALEGELDTPEGTCECGDLGFALVHDYKTSVIECLCKHHLSIVKLQLTMKRFVFKEWFLSPSKVQFLAGVKIHSLIVLTDVFGRDTLQINGTNYGYRESKSYLDVPLGKLRGSRIEQVHCRMGEVYFLKIGNCRLAVHSWPE